MVDILKDSSSGSVSSTGKATSAAGAAGEDLRLARSMAKMNQSGLRELRALAVRPGVLSLAVGLPAPELFPMA